MNMDGLEPELQRIAELIYNGHLKPGQIDKTMVKKIAEQLMKGVFTGYGKSLTSDNLTPSERSFLSKITENVFVFSGFKNYHQLKETSLLLKTDDGKLKSFNDFLTDVKAINHTYNEVYLNSEYSNAIASAQTAATWQDYENNGVDTLTYVTAGDDRVREEHAILEGITLPIDDPFWSTYYPPNDWGCRCDTSPGKEGKEVRIANSELPDIPEMFQNNVGKTGIVFPDTHPYFDVSKATAASIESQVEDIIPHLPEPTQRAYESKAGGYIEAEPGINKQELRENTEIAKVLADLNHKIKLLAPDNTPGVKTPDAIIDGKRFEFKTNKKATISAIDNELRKAKDQADHIVLNIKSKIPVEDLADAISDRMNRSKSVQSVWLIRNNELIKLNPSEFKSKDKIIKAIKKGG